jgi:hypothetical protein
MESVYHFVTIHVNETSWAHVWRLRSRYLRTGYDKLGLVHCYSANQLKPDCSCPKILEKQLNRWNWARPPKLSLTALLTGRRATCHPCLHVPPMPLPARPCPLSWPEGDAKALFAISLHCPPLLSSTLPCVERCRRQRPPPQAASSHHDHRHSCASEPQRVGTHPRAAGHHEEGSQRPRHCLLPPHGCITGAGLLQPRQ